MSKGGGQTITNVQALPPGVQEALTQAYTDYNPFDAAFAGVDAYNPQAFAGNRTAQLGQGELNAINAANSALNTTPGFLGDAQNAVCGLCSGGIAASALHYQ
jgi:hypothetical protein